MPSWDISLGRRVSTGVRWLRPTLNRELMVLFLDQ